MKLITIRYGMGYVLITSLGFSDKYMHYKSYKCSTESSILG